MFALCIGCGFIIITAGFVVGLILAPLIAGPLLAVTVVYFCWFVLQSRYDAEVHPADKVAHILYEENAGKTPDLPEKLRGVFWFSDNAAPELLVTFEGSAYNKETNTITVISGGPLNWSYSGNKAGWIYWAMLRVSYLFCSKLYIKFDADMKKATMPLYMCGCCPVAMGMWWTMEQIDEHNWDRIITLYCMPWRKWETGSYVLKRIIGPDGKTVPAFDEMMQQIESKKKVKGIDAKPLLQIMNGRPGGGCCCGLCPGPDRYNKPGEV